MAFKIIISNEAQFDLEQSYLFYKERANKKVADNFFNDFKRSINVISKSPFFKIWIDDFHVKPLRKYPFLLFYTINESEKIIVIIRIFHTSQSPEKYP